MGYIDGKRRMDLIPSVIFLKVSNKRPTYFYVVSYLGNTQCLRAIVAGLNGIWLGQCPATDDF